MRTEIYVIFIFIAITFSGSSHSMPTEQNKGHSQPPMTVCLLSVLLHAAKNVAQRNGKKEAGVIGAI